MSRAKDGTHAGKRGTMPITDADFALTEIAKFANQFNTSTLIIPDFRGPVLEVPKTPVGSPTSVGLMTFTTDCFGVDPLTAGAIGESYIKDWAMKCGVADNPKLLQDFIEKRLDRTPGIDKAPTVSQRLVQATANITAWKCQSVDQAGKIAEIAERMYKKFSNSSNPVDTKSRQSYVAKISNLAAKDGKSSSDVYATALRLEKLWSYNEKLVTDVYVGDKTLTIAEGPRRADEVLTEVAKCADALAQKKTPLAQDGTPLTTKPGQLDPLLDNNIRTMVEAASKALFGLDSSKEVIRPEVIADWANRSPADAIGSNPGLKERGENFTQYVAKRIGEVHALHRTGTSVRLATAYQLMQSRNCSTIVEASQVEDYAESLAAKDPKTYKDTDTALELIRKSLDKTKELQGSSQFEYIRRLDKVPEQSKAEILTSKTSLPEVERELDPSKPKEDPEKKDSKKDREKAAHN